MNKAMIEVDTTQLLNALAQLPSYDLKKIIDTLFLKGLFKRPDFEEVSSRAKKIIKKQGLSTNVIEEAIQWARKQK